MPFALIKGQITFHKGTKTTQWKRTVFLQMGGKTRYQYEKKNEVLSYTIHKN